MQLTFRPMNADEAQEYVSWRYDAPYDIYNIEIDGDELQEHIEFCVEPANRMYAIRSDRGELVGFCVFGADARIKGGDYSQDYLDIGMGLRPDQTGKGLGVKFAEAVIEHAVHTYQPDGLRVTILTYNKRAQRVWECVGFEKSQAFVSLHDGSECVVMTRSA